VILQYRTLKLGNFLHFEVLFSTVSTDFCYTAYIMGLSLSFELPVALIFSPITNSLLCGGTISTAGKFTSNIRDPSRTFSYSRCYGLRPFMTALYKNLKKTQQWSIEVFGKHNT